MNCIFAYDSIIPAVMTATLESLSIQEGAEGVMYDTDLLKVEICDDSEVYDIYDSRSVSNDPFSVYLRDTPSAGFIRGFMQISQAKGQS